MAFKLSKQQIAERDELTDELRHKGETLNTAIIAFNEAVEPLSKALDEAVEDYNGVLERALKLIAVGAPIAGRPPHRSVRAACLHTAPTSGV